MPDKNSDNEAESPVKDYSTYAGMAIKMAVVITLFVFAGKYLDKWAETEKQKIFLIIFSLLGVGIAIYSTLRDLIK